MLNNSLLAIFFLYFILLSGYCRELLNCGLQRYMDNHIIFRHVLIFLSIFVFTFVLDWYTLDSINIKSIGQTDKEAYKQKAENISAEFNIHQIFV